MWKSAGRVPSLRVFTPAFALQLSKKYGKTSVRIRKTSGYLASLLGLSVGITVHLRGVKWENPLRHGRIWRNVFLDTNENQRPSYVQTRVYVRRVSKDGTHWNITGFAGRLLCKCDKVQRP
jgi:hypothetical protein